MKTGTAMALVKESRGLTTFGVFGHPFREFERRINRLFGENFGYMPEGEESFSLATWAPACDIYENENELVVKVELPDVKREDVNAALRLFAREQIGACLVAARLKTALPTTGDTGHTGHTGESTSLFWLPRG